MPYFYVPVPRGFDAADLDPLADALNVRSSMFQAHTFNYAQSHFQLRDSTVREALSSLESSS
jgi:hypothetical protein